MITGMKHLNCKKEAKTAGTLPFGKEKPGG